MEQHPARSPNVRPTRTNWSSQPRRRRHRQRATTRKRERPDEVSARDGRQQSSREAPRSATSLIHCRLGSRPPPAVHATPAPATRPNQPKPPASRTRRGLHRGENQHSGSWFLTPTSPWPQGAHLWAPRRAAAHTNGSVFGGDSCLRLQIAPLHGRRPRWGFDHGGRERESRRLRKRSSIPSPDEQNQGAHPCFIPVHSTRAAAAKTVRHPISARVRHPGSTWTVYAFSLTSVLLLHRS